MGSGLACGGRGLACGGRGVVLRVNMTDAAEPVELRKGATTIELGLPVYPRTRHIRLWSDTAIAVDGVWLVQPG